MGVILSQTKEYQLLPAPTRSWAWEGRVLLWSLQEYGSARMLFSYMRPLELCKNYVALSNSLRQSLENSTDMDIFPFLLIQWNFPLLPLLRSGFVYTSTLKLFYKNSEFLSSSGYFTLLPYLSVASLFFLGFYFCCNHVCAKFFLGSLWALFT